MQKKLTIEKTSAAMQIVRSMNMGTTDNMDNINFIYENQNDTGHEKRKEKYKKATEFPYYKNNDVIMKYRISDDKKLVNRMILELVKPKVDVSEISRGNTNRKKLEKLAKTQYADELYARIPKEALLTTKDFKGDLTLQTILQVHREQLIEYIGKASADAFDTLYELCSNPVFAEKSLNAITVDDCLSAIREYVEKQQLNSRDSVLHDRCCDLLKKAFAFSCSSDFINKNPMEYFKRNKDIAAVIRNHMKAGALTVNEDYRLYKKYSSDILNPINLGVALLHQTGLSVAEVCGLKFGDVYSMDRLTGHEPRNPLGNLDPNSNYVMYISRSYRKIDNTYKLTSIINGTESYRFVPLRRSCVKLICDYYWNLRNTFGVTDDQLVSYPIVCTSDRQKELIPQDHCRPDNLRKYAKEYLKEIGVDTRMFYLPPIKQSDYSGERVLEHDPSVRLLHLNYQERVKHVCKLSSDEIDYILGHKPKNVDSRHYRDFRELFNQLSMKTKLDRWVINEETIELQPGILIAGGSESCKLSGQKSQIIAPSTSANRAHAVIKIKVEPGNIIDINLRCFLGMNGSVLIKSP